jgi:hypothetical protein
MSASELHELVAFLGERFDTTDRRFDELRAEIPGRSSSATS